MSSFNQTFSGSPVNTSEVAYASYPFSTNFTLYWPQFSAGQTNVAARFMNMNATTTGLSTYMPDATLASVGYDTIISNNGSNSFNVVNFGGGAICTIAPNQIYYILLTNNSTQNGTWQIVQFGVGTSSASAAALAGAGLAAAAGLLQLDLNGNEVSAGFTLTTTSLAQLYIWTGGSGVISLPSAAAIGNGFFFMVANNGSGSLTLTPSSTTIDGGSTSVFSQTQSGFVFSDGTNWFTVGKGIQNTFSVTLLNLNVAGNSDVTETSVQAQNIIQQFTGALTGSINVIVPATVQLYEVNNLTTGAYSVTVKTPSGTGVAVPQGQTSILYCDGTNVVNGFTASVTSTIALTNGSAASPSLSFASSPTTGFFSASANTMSASANAHEVMRFSSATSAVNYLSAIASATATALNLTAAGTDTNIGININPKGSGTVTLGLLDGTAIGSNTPSTAAFTTLSASSTVSGAGFSTYLASPPAIGGSSAAAGHFTTLSASSTVSGTGFSTYLASPPAIGGSAAAAGSFTTLSASGAVTLSSTINKITLTQPATAATLTIVNNKTFMVDNTLELAGTDSTKMTFPSTSDTVVTLTASQTLTNKTLTAPVLGAASATSLTLSSTTGIVGTTTNNDAATGSVGEYVTSVILGGSAVSLSSGAASNITTISLTAGDWDVGSAVAYNSSSGSPSYTYMMSSWNTVSATSAGQPDVGIAVPANGMGTDPVVIGPTIRLSISGTNTVYLVGQAAWSSGTVSGYGRIWARRRR